MGVEMRMHVFFPALALVCLGLSGGSGFLRGMGLFFLCVAAVVVREIARLLMAAYLNLKLRAVLLLPIGGLFAYANPESQEAANQGFGQFAMAFTGPIVNCITALMIAAACIGSGGDVHLLTHPFITADHLVRSMVWMQVGLGVLHLLPAYPLDFGRLLRGNFARVHGLTPGGRAASGIGQLIAVAVMLLGWLLAHSPWLVIAGFFIMIGAQIEDQGVFFQSVVDTVHMREVMLVRCVHSLQEDFPVVRGPQLVGIVSRQRIVEALRNDGNGYIQSIMSRAFQVARPEDTLGTTIRRISAGHGLSLIPVTESGKVVGIVSVQNLMSSMSLLAEQRRIESEDASE
jgi:CBS domain-containing protein